MSQLLNRKQHWRNQLALAARKLAPELSSTQMKAVSDRALGMSLLLASILWSLVRFLFIGSRLVRHHAPGVSEEINEIRERIPPRLF